jgi:hypothetical protein
VGDAVAQICWPGLRIPPLTTQDAARLKFARQHAGARRASVQRVPSVQNELFYTDGRNEAGSKLRRCRAPPKPPNTRGAQAYKDLGCAPHGRCLQCKPVNVPPASMLPTGVEGVLTADQIRKSFHDTHCDAFRWYWPDIQRGRYRSNL